jgi:hypothetical protein
MLELCNAQERASVSASVHVALRVGLRALERQIRFRAQQALAEKTPSIMLNHSLNALTSSICSKCVHWSCVKGVVRTFAHDWACPRPHSPEDEYMTDCKQCVLFHGEQAV